jgi:hypothetical protein
VASLKRFLNDELLARGQYRASGLERGSLWRGRLSEDVYGVRWMSLGFVVFSFGGLVLAAVLFGVPFAGMVLSSASLFLPFLSFSSPHLRVRRALSRFSHPPAPFRTISDV